MARPRTPTNILDARGSFKRHADRKAARKNEPVVREPLGEAPATFTPDQQQAWKDIASWCPAGVLTIADRLAVERAARILALDRIGMASDAQGRAFDAMLGKFGMTPADRSKVSAVKPQENAADSKWGGIG